MRSKKTNKLMRFLLCLGFLSIAEAAICARVLSCKEQRASGRHLCLLQHDSKGSTRVGSQVIVYQDRVFWSATGNIVKVKGDYAIGSFGEYGKTPHKGLYAKINDPGTEGILDWEQSFSGSESEL